MTDRALYQFINISPGFAFTYNRKYWVKLLKIFINDVAGVGYADVRRMGCQ